MAGAKLTINADSSKAVKELSSFERKTKKIASSISKGFKERIGHKMFDGLIGAARQVPGMLNDAIKAASDMNEETSKSEAIFGKSSQSISKWAETSAEKMGMAKVAALEATGGLGGLFLNMGMTSDKAAQMSMEMTQLAADMGSFNNAKTEDAIYAIGAALRGESEPIRKFNVQLNDAVLKAEAFAMGLYDGKGALDPATKSLAAYEVILKQTKIQQGDFAKTSDGLANSKKILGAQIDNLYAKIGENLLPVVQDLVNKMNDADFDKIGKGVSNLAKTFIDLSTEIGKAYEKYKEFVGFAMDAAGIDRTTSTPEANTSSLVKNSGGLRGPTQAQKNALVEGLKEIQKTNTTPVTPAATNATTSPTSFLPGRQLGAFSRIAQNMMGIGKDLASSSRGRLLDANSASFNSVQDSLFSLNGLSSNSAVSSMQRIGGGGGVASMGLDIQKKQADLLQQLVDIESARAQIEKGEVSDY